MQARSGAIARDFERDNYVTSEIQQSDWTLVLKSDRLFRQPFVVMRPAAARGSGRGGGGGIRAGARGFLWKSRKRPQCCV